MIKYKLKKETLKPPPIRSDIDDDVKNEIDKVKALTTPQIEQRNLVLRGITKFYDKLLAVNQIHLEVDSSECFGLIGVNVKLSNNQIQSNFESFSFSQGAGKTTTFKMMIGDERISSGDAWMRGVSMKQHTEKVLKSYCPQFDALLLDLTGRESLKIFSLLRGIPRSEIGDIINKLSTQLDFKQHLDKKAKAYSGGNKRKLSTAIALLGEPFIIFLDEPSTGMDPKAKRKLWDIVNKTRNDGKSVILTSHSMEECEALCTRLAIMVDGEFKCLGSVQHLKNKFAKGFTLTIRMEREDDQALLDEVKQRVSHEFPSAVLKEQFLKLLTFHINDANFRWSQAFAVMTNMKSEVAISDFVLSQMSLEQVFLFFSRNAENQNGRN